MLQVVCSVSNKTGASEMTLSLMSNKEMYYSFALN